jgi:hypothetical protein
MPFLKQSAFLGALEEPTETKNQKVFFFTRQRKKSPQQLYHRT